MALPPQLADLESRLAGRVEEALGRYRRAVELRLREAVERLAAASDELPAPELGGLLEGLELSALDLGTRREAAREAVGSLLAAVRDLDRTRTQAEALDVLLERAAAWADRAALLLARDEELVGWGERGFGPHGFVGRSLLVASALGDRLLAIRGCLRFDAGEAASITSEIGASAGGAAVVVPLVLRDRIAALVWADRRDGEPELAALQLLVAATAQRLELQALSDRAQTPTLYDEAEAAGEALALWSTAPPAVVAAPSEVPAAEETPAPPPSEALELEVAGVPVAIEPEPAGAEPAVSSFEEAAAATWEPVAPSDAEPLPSFEPEPELAAQPPVEAPFAAEPLPMAPLAAAETTIAAEPLPSEPVAAPETASEAESLPEFDYASEPESSSAATAAFETIPPPPSPTAPDLLGTVRMAIPGVPSRPAEEATAPFEVLPPPASSGAGTHEIPIAEAKAPAPVAEPDLTEDATLLTTRQAPVAPPELAPPPHREEDANDRTSARGGRTTQVAPPPDVQGPGLAFMSGRAGRAFSDSPVHEEAKRLARLLISEIKLYNEEQVLEGRRNRDLYHRLREDIDRSRQIFDERVDPAVRSEVDYFQQELVRSLAGGDPRALGI